jgi:hypothetical protein
MLDPISQKRCGIGFSDPGVPSRPRVLLVPAGSCLRLYQHGQSREEARTAQDT